MFNPRKQVLQDLHAEHTTVTLDEKGSLVGIAPVTDLAKPLQEQCRRVVLTCNELLRHFWACLPLTSQPRQDKAKRLDRALQAQYDRSAASLLWTPHLGSGSRICLPSLDGCQ